MRSRPDRYRAATYAGDTSFLGSASAPATQVVSSVTLSTRSLLFGNQLVGTTSASQAVTLTNVGLNALAITSIAFAGDFLDSTTCPVGGNLRAGSSYLGAFRSLGLKSILSVGLQGGSSNGDPLHRKSNAAKRRTFTQSTAEK